MTTIQKPQNCMWATYLMLMAVISDGTYRINVVGTPISDIFETVPYTKSTGSLQQSQSS